MSPEIKALVVKVFSRCPSAAVRQAVEQHPDLALQCLLEDIAWESAKRDNDVYRSVRDAGDWLRKLVEEGNGQGQHEARETETSS